MLDHRLVNLGEFFHLYLGQIIVVIVQLNHVLRNQVRADFMVAQVCIHEARGVQNRNNWVLKIQRVKLEHFKSQFKSPCLVQIVVDGFFA